MFLCYVLVSDVYDKSLCLCECPCVCQCRQMFTYLLPHCRFFFGKNKVMILALGKTPADEFLPGLHHLSKHLRGETGLLFTNKKKADVLKWVCVVYGVFFFFFCVPQLYLGGSPFFFFFFFCIPQLYRVRLKSGRSRVRIPLAPGFFQGWVIPVT